jgi:hypothetical protein
VVESPAGQRHPVELIAGCGDQVGVAVAEVERRVPGQAVEVPAALDVGHPGTGRVGDDDRQRMVVVRAVRLGEVYQPGTVVQPVDRGGRYFTGCHSRIS